MIEDIRFEFLAALRGDRTVTSEEYTRLTRGMAHEAKVDLVRWLGEAEIEIRPSLSMQALYHAAPGRQYKPTRRELDSGRFECPGCHVVMVRVTRKAKDCIYRCPGCSWAIARSDIFEPEIGKEPELQPGPYPEGIAPSPEEEPGPW